VTAPLEAPAPLAPWSRRFGAALVDGGVVLAISLGVLALVGARTGWPFAHRHLSSSDRPWRYATTLAVALAYYPPLMRLHDMLAGTRVRYARAT
jgi:hypothetical protein